MGKRTNTILQSAFFKLADILPIEKAVEQMKYMAKKSYLKKGEEVVQLNYNAIDAGIDAIVKVDVPEAWKNITETTPVAEVEGTRPELVKLQSALKEVDPDAFLNIVSSTEIMGKGFKPLAE